LASPKPKIPDPRGEECEWWCFPLLLDLRCSWLLWWWCELPPISDAPSNQPIFKEELGELEL
jgi:hypothetical protein